MAELDYLLASRLGVAEELTALEELAGRAYDLPIFDAADIDAAAAFIAQYRDLGIGVADASLVVLAQRYGTKQILTLDRRHFGVVRSLDGGHFDLLPD